MEHHGYASWLYLAERSPSKASSWGRGVEEARVHCTVNPTPWSTLPPLCCVPEQAPCLLPPCQLIDRLSGQVRDIDHLIRTLSDQSQLLPGASALTACSLLLSRVGSSHLQKQPLSHTDTPKSEPGLARATGGCLSGCQLPPMPLSPCRQGMCSAVCHEPPALAGDLGKGRERPEP